MCFLAIAFNSIALDPWHLSFLFYPLLSSLPSLFSFASWSIASATLFPLVLLSHLLEQTLKSRLMQLLCFF